MYHSILNQAKELKCSPILIDNLEISGLEEDALELEENIRETQEYLAREEARFNPFLHTLAIAKESARLSVVEAGL
jgi:hypothetical protein